MEPGCPLGKRGPGPYNHPGRACVIELEGLLMSGKLIQPFAGLRPAAGKAGDIAAPPYDVVNTEEARAWAEGKPNCFFHVSKPEIDLAPGTDPKSAAVYDKGAENIGALIDSGLLVRDAVPSYYVYRLTMGDHVQTGLVVGASIDAYDANLIRKHEFTRPDKEDDRVHQIEAVAAHTGPVMLAHRPNDDVAAILESKAATEPASDVVVEGVRHQIWVVDDAKTVARLSDLFNSMAALYIADGHHRSAAGSRVAAARRGAGKQSDVFLAVSFPQDEMQILDYNRVVKDLNGLDEGAFLEKVGAVFNVTLSDGPAKPSRAGTYGMYLSGKWYQLVTKSSPDPDAGAVARLDISVLTDQLLTPVLGIGDPRVDPRIDFIGGIRGMEGLERRVDSGEMAVAFALFPTSMDDLMAVADAEDVMPPKSTWFEPKLADGLVSLVID